MPLYSPASHMFHQSSPVLHGTVAILPSMNRLKFLFASFIMMLPVMFCALVSAQSFVIIDARTALAAHPAGSAVVDIQTRQQEELAPILQKLEELQAKLRSGQALTIEEQDQGETLMNFLQEAQRRYTEEILTASEPAVQVVNYTICQLAQENGYDIVIDGNTAGQDGLGLIVYANAGLDITQRVVELVQAYPTLPEQSAGNQECLQRTLQNQRP